MSGQSTTRRAHKKSKTGCATCKARRIKCSEERPACKQCVKSSRRCEGYSYLVDDKKCVVRPKTSDTSQCLRTAPSTSLSPYFGGCSMSPLELRSLQFFHDRTVPSLAGFFESNLWQRLLLQISVTEPGLRHAMIAVGFLQKLSELHGLPALDFEQAPAATRLDRHDTFAVDQYMKAVTLIRGRLTTSDPCSIITLVACILFVVLEFLRGERKAAYAHLNSGLHIIQGRTTCPSSSSKVPIHTRPLNETDLAPVFARISIFSTLHRQPKSDPFRATLDLDLDAPCPGGEPFETLEQARMVIINHMNAAIRFCSMVIRRVFSSPEAIEATRADIHARLDGWSKAFESFLPTARFRDPSSYTADMRGAVMLRVHHTFAKVWVTVVRCPQNESAYDNILDLFLGLVDACEAIINFTNDPQRAAEPSTFALDCGIIPPLFFTATKCREPFVRRRAISLLYRAPRREGPWDAITAAKIAEVHVSVEEEELEQVSTRDWPPLRSRIIEYDLQTRDPKTPNRQLLVLRMVRKPGVDECELRKEYLYYQDVGMQSVPYSDRSMKKAVGNG